jgi:hypothetical protein
MTIHYHGTPISPKAELEKLAGRHFCVSFNRPDNILWCVRYGQSLMLDNGAFSFWRSQAPVDWEAYYSWVEPLLAWRQNWAVIPDVIDGTGEDNDRLIEAWPFGDRGAPVWHLHEPISRLLKLARKWPRVCLGSSGKYHMVGSTAWHCRMVDAMNRLCGNGPSPVWLHMLRGMQCSEWHYPFASVDSTDIARNHARGGDIRERADRWDTRQCPAVWTIRDQQTLFGGNNE